MGLCLLMIFPTACRRAPDDRDLILKLVDSVEDYAEKKYTASIMALIAEDFSDMENRSSTDLEGMLETYFERYTGIVVNALATRFIRLEGLQAEIETDVSMSSGAARMFRKLISYSGQTYRFSLKLKKTNGKWLVFHAAWQPVYLEELSPESMEKLKKLFPRL